VILTVTLNAALDITYGLERVAWNSVNRVDAVDVRAGGKGVNVARVLHALDVDAVVTGLAGGATGAELRAELARAGLRDELVTIAGETRRTVVIAARNGSETTLFNEPGPQVSMEEWRAFEERFRNLVAGAEAVVLSGSLPPGVPLGAYASLGAAAGSPVVLDADGEALRLGLDARPAVVKPNADELGRATGLAVSNLEEIAAAADSVLEAGAQAAVVSLGAEGLLACTRDGHWRARPAQRVEGNATGAGDAATAALVLGLVRGQTWPERLLHAAALSAAAVASPVAGEFDRELYERLLEDVVVEAL
jgi:tagatose 6-phosphate kinase